MSSIRSRQANPILERMRSDGWGAVPESPPYGSEDRDSDSDREKTPEAVKSHEGWKIWQKVVDATTDGVQGVRVAVQNRMNTEDKLCESDEEDYTGGDSHLIRVMKEYHISQCSDPDDLPTWLFPERPRRGERAWASFSPSTNAAGRRAPPGSTGSYDPYERPSANADRYPTRPSAADNERGPQPAAGSGRERRFHAEHGNRTAQKLRQMKSDRGGSKSSM